MGALRAALTRIAIGSCAACVGSLALEGRAVAQDTAPAPDPAKKEEARRHFDRGIALLRDPEGEKVEAAYLEFKVAYELSRSPRVLGNIGYCAMRMERNSESVEAYRSYLKLVPTVDSAERQQIEMDLGTMTDGAATMTATYAASGAWTLVDERTPARGALITNLYDGTSAEEIKILIHPGHHTVHVKVNGEEQGRWEFEAVAGQSLSHVFQPKPAAPAATATAAAPEKVLVADSKTPQIVTMAVGGLLVVGSGVTGILAYDKMKSVERECPNNVCSSGNYGDVSSARTLGTVTDVLWISGAVIAATGAIWFALTPSHHEEDAAPAVAGACVPGACGVTLRGSF
jgi:hypothetical protein